MGGSDRGLRKDLGGNNERRCGVVREAAQAWQAQLDAAKLTRRAARRPAPGVCPRTRRNEKLIERIRSV